MAKALVLGALKTHFLGGQSNSTGEDRTVVVPLSNRVLRAAWISTLGISVRTGYGIILLRVGDVGVANEGRMLAEGWFGNAQSLGGDDALLHGENVAWDGELPLFDPRSIRLIFNVRNDSGALIPWTGGYAWQDFEENDRPA